MIGKKKWKRLKSLKKISQIIQIAIKLMKIKYDRKKNEWGWNHKKKN